MKRLFIILLSAATLLGLYSAAFAAGTPFSDIPSGADYADAVAWCVGHGLMNGAGGGKFNPDATLDRRTLATVLYRAEGEPAVNAENRFSDVQNSQWYTDAAVWADQQGLITGYGGGVFGPTRPVTKVQMDIILQRYQGKDPAWPGDPAQTPATRAEVAMVLQANLDRDADNSDDGFVSIRGGAFTMGSPSDEPEREADEAAHSVTVGSFYLAPTEVTQKEYQAVTGANPSETRGDDLPVTNVSWYDAIEYCNSLSRAKGLTEAYAVSRGTVAWNRAANGYRLPTEAEWEYAARAGSSTPFHFGGYVHDSEANCYNAYGYNNDATGSWINGYPGHTAHVKSYPANANGLYEIHGNAAEWVWDWYGAYDTAAATDPSGPSAGRYKIARGGAWNDFPKHIRSAYRSANPPDVGTYGIGLRLARGPVGTGMVTSTFSDVDQKPEKKVLIAYFSQTGNTEGLTNIIAEMTGADVFHIERTTPYSSNHNGFALYNEALNELRSFAVPDLKTSLEDAGYKIDDYDTILLGYCNWWASIPAPVRSFLKQYDMSGKTIIPYCSMGGGQFGQTVSAVAKLAPDSNIKEGLAVSYSSYDREKIQKWLAGRGILS